MSTLVAQTISNGTVSTSSANVIQGSAKAWVNFNGTGTVAIRASYNVSSITDNGTGDYTVNFTNAMPDANYSVAGTCVGSTTNTYSMICGANSSVLNTGSVRFGVIASTSGANQDYACISISIFR